MSFQFTVPAGTASQGEPTLSTKRPTRPTRTKTTASKTTASKTSGSKKTTRTTTASTAASKRAVTPKTAATKAAKARVKSQASPQSRKLLQMILKSLDGDKAEDIISIDMTGKSPMADFMVVASGRSNRHVAALAEHLTAILKQDGLNCRVEGLQQGDWVLVDAVDVIVHIFRPEVRSFYSLETMWGGGEPVASASQA